MSTNNSSFYSALSTPDSSIFENTLVDSAIKYNLLTRDNLTIHHSGKIYKEFKDDRMMKYITQQQSIVQKQELDYIWFRRKSMTNKVGYNGNHLGHFYILKNVKPKENESKFKRMFGRVAVYFLRCSNLNNLYHEEPRRNHDDKNNTVLVAIGYDEWV